jgi:ribonuclease HI
MRVATPHYLLFSESTRANAVGQWRFVLQSVDGTDQFEATDSEPQVHGERLELLAVVRGLEALAQPSRVTLVTASRYVNRGLTYGLTEWRANDWQWEHFGQMVPVKNRDLWQRVDRALMFHQLDCKRWRFDLAHGELAPEHYGDVDARVTPRREPSLRGRLKRRLAACERWWDEQVESLALLGAQCGTRLLPLPWLD